MQTVINWAQQQFWQNIFHGLLESVSLRVQCELSVWSLQQGVQTLPSIWLQHVVCVLLIHIELGCLWQQWTQPYFSEIKFTMWTNVTLGRDKGQSVWEIFELEQFSCWDVATGKSLMIWGVIEGGIPADNASAFQWSSVMASLPRLSQRALFSNFEPEQTRWSLHLLLPVLPEQHQHRVK